jgi:hypothetical protein
LPRFLRNSEKTAPKTATKVTIIAAMMKGDGSAGVFTGETTVKPKNVIKATKSNRILVLFILTPFSGDWLYV